jgi:hypothetical protein
VWESGRGKAERARVSTEAWEEEEEEEEEEEKGEGGQLGRST